MTRDTVISACIKWYAHFAERIATVPVQHAAILPTEMLAFVAVAMELGCTDVFECGRRFGYSTEVLVRFPWNVTSIEMTPDREADERIHRQRFDSPVFVDGVEAQTFLLVGNANHELPRWIEDGCALLMDGPKGQPAIDLVSRLERRPRFWALHDCYAGSAGRAALDGAFFTDDKEFVDRFGELDREMLEFRGYSCHGDLLGEANVLGIVGDG